MSERKASSVPLIELVRYAGPQAVPIEVDEDREAECCGLITEDGVDRTHTLGRVEAVIVESEYQGCVGDCIDCEDVEAQIASELVREGGALMSLLFPGWHWMPTEVEVGSMREVATSIVREGRQGKPSPVNYRRSNGQW